MTDLCAPCDTPNLCIEKKQCQGRWLKRPFEFGDKVAADGDLYNPMTVIGLLYVPELSVSVKCAYWCNGDHKEVWIDAWRLAKWFKP